MGNKHYFKRNFGFALLLKDEKDEKDQKDPKDISFALERELHKSFGPFPLLGEAYVLYVLWVLFVLYVL